MIECYGASRKSSVPILSVPISSQLTVCREGCTLRKNVVSKVCEGGLNNGLPYGMYNVQTTFNTILQ